MSINVRFDGAASFAVNGIDYIAWPATDGRTVVVTCANVQGIGVHPVLVAEWTHGDDGVRYLRRVASSIVSVADVPSFLRIVEEELAAVCRLPFGRPPADR